jgi:predicted dehydrogenase
MSKGLSIANTTGIGAVVVGTGSIGSAHLSLLREAGVSPLFAVSARGERRAELEAQGFRTAPSLNEMEGRVAAVIVATDTIRHPEDACRALAQGCHVLVEKPLAVDAGEGRHIQEAARGAGRQAYVGCLLRFSDSINRFRELVADLGRVHSVRVECQSYLPHWRPDRPYPDSYSARAGEGGVLRDLVHEIDYSGWIYGWPEAVRARVRNLGRLGIEAEETADLEWLSGEECLVSVSLDYLSPVSRRRMRATGERGTLEWDGLTGTVALTRTQSDRQTFHFDQTRDGRLLAQDLAFLAACSGHADTRLATCEDGLRALAVCDAARRASHSRTEEQVIYA